MTLTLILSLLGVGGAVAAALYFIGPVVLLAFAKRVPWQVWASIAIGALLTLGYCHAEKTGETKGAAKVEVKHAAAHKKTVAEAVADTINAQTTVDAIGATTRNSNRLATEFAQTKIEELRNATTLPPAAAGEPAPIVDGVRIDASLNALIDRAERAAEAADGEP